jgi:uncharacterized membrane protein YhhN
MPKARIFALAVTAYAALAIAGALLSPEARALHYLFKPITTALLVAMAWRSPDRHGFRAGVLAGLLLSLVGDIALMLPVDAFAAGLGAFLLAHLAYIGAFLRRAAGPAALAALALYALLAVFLLARLLPNVPPGLQWPVLAYVAVLVGMAALAFGARGVAGPGLALGGALFVLSDGLLAWDRFVVPLPLAPLWVLASYWGAQWCIARSVAGKGGHG